MASYSDLNVIMENSPLHALATQCQTWESEKISVITLMDKLQSLQHLLTGVDDRLAGINNPDEMQMLTYCSNLLCIQSSNALDAELKINLLLNHMTSQSSWVRCVTCSLLKNLWLKLDSTGKHFVVQTTILSKNLMLTLNDSLSKNSPRFDTCVCICLASLVMISSVAVRRLPSLRLSRPFVALSLATILDVLNYKFNDVNNPSSILIYRVAADGLCKLICVNNLWLEALNVTQCYQCIQAYRQAITNHFEEIKDDWTCCKLLTALNNDDVFTTFSSQPSILHAIVADLLNALKPYEDGDLLELRWTILSILMRFAKSRLGNQISDWTKLDGSSYLKLIRNGCCKEEQVKALKQFLLSLLSDDNDD